MNWPVVVLLMASAPMAWLSGMFWGRAREASVSLNGWDVVVDVMEGLQAVTASSDLDAAKLAAEAAMASAAQHWTTPEKLASRTGRPLAQIYRLLEAHRSRSDPPQQ